MKEIVLIGGGGHCRSVIDVIEQEGRFKIAGVVDRPEFPDSNVMGYSVIGSDSDLNNLVKKYKYALITVGQVKSSVLKMKLFNLAMNTGFILPNIISPRAYISKHAVIGKGSVIMHDVLINANVKIGDNCIINSKALIEHDAFIKDHCHISTNAIINGGVIVGARSFIGSGSISKENIKIEDGYFSKAGSIIK